LSHYDYIITGSGAAGLSLLMRFMQHREFDNKRILVIDKLPKKNNDRTWCFWEKNDGLFQPVVYRQWNKVEFYSNDFSSELDFTPYQYKMIRGVDFYNYVYQQAENRSNIEFKFGAVEAVGNEGNYGLVIFDGLRYTAQYIFNSILFSKPTITPGKYFLLQHFKGWIIETPHPAFEPGKATLMDFRVAQHKGTAFVYVLPFDSTKALVEYTMFTAQVLQDNEYDEHLRGYIQDHLHIKEYEVLDTETGVIPMTNAAFQKRIGKVINIGTAGGQTKASSGYTFQFIQKHSEQIINDLLQYGEVKNHGNLFDNRFRLYDSTLLNVLQNNKLGGDAIFADLFKKNPTDRVLRFLDNESSLEDEIQLMATMPKGIFAKAAFQEIMK
jgi:lycopene beta-cyclase